MDLPLDSEHWKDQTSLNLKVHDVKTKSNTEEIFDFLGVLWNSIFVWPFSIASSTILLVAPSSLNGM